MHDHLIKSCLFIALSFGFAYHILAQDRIFQSEVFQSQQKIKTDSLIQWAEVRHHLQPDLAWKYVEEAIQLSKEISYSQGLQNAYLLKGRFEENAQQPDRALNSYQLGLQEAIPLVDAETRVTIMNRIANLYRKQNEWDSALHYQQKAVSQAEHTDDLTLKAKTWKNLGYTHWMRKATEEALYCYERVLYFNLQMDDPEVVAQSYYDIGLCMQRLGRYSSHVTFHLRAIELWKKTDHLLEMAIALQDLGFAYQKLGDITKAIAALEEALPIFNMLHKSLEVADCYMSLGHIYLQQHDLPKALINYDKSLSLNQSINDQYGIITSFISLGIAQREAKDYSQALSFFQKALEENNVGKYPNLTAYTYDAIGRTYYLLNQVDSANSYFNEALTLRQHLYGSQHPDVSIIHIQLAKTHLKSHALTEAMQHAQKALFALGIQIQNNNKETPIIKGVSSKLLLLDALAVKADILAAMDYLPEALQHYQIAVNYLVNQAMNDLDFSEDQLSLMERYRGLFEGGIHVAYSMYSQTHNESDLAHAFTLFESSKGFLLREALQHAKIIHYAGVPDSLLQKETNLKWAITFYEKQLYEAQQTHDTVAIINHTKQLLTKQDAYHNFKDLLAQNYSDYYHLNYDTATTNIESIQSELELNEMLLSYFVGDNHLYIFSLTQDTVHLFEKAAISSINQHVNDFRRVLTDYQYITDSTQQANEQYIASATWLFQHLIEQPSSVSTHDIHTLTIVPDGVLNTIPFEALLANIPKASENYRTWPYLIKKYAIGYAFAATLPQSASFKGKKQYHFTGFAPSYDTNLETTPNPLLASFSRNESLPLPEAQEEVNSIAGIMGGKVYKNATIADFNKYASQSQFVHFSGHAVVDDNNPAFSNLIFTSKDTLENQFLYAADIYDMALNAEMVVLSACNSGYGKVREGEGMMSIARAFAYAGCNSLVTSLWKVPDRATKNIMINFYNQLSDDLQKDQALQQAKLQYLQKAEVAYAHPLYWASFVAIGDMKSIPHQSGKFYWITLAFLALLLMGIVIWRNRTNVSKAY